MTVTRQTEYTYELYLLQCNITILIQMLSYSRLRSLKNRDLMLSGLSACGHSILRE